MSVLHRVEMPGRVGRSRELGMVLCSSWAVVSEVVYWISCFSLNSTDTAFRFSLPLHEIRRMGAKSLRLVAPTVAMIKDVIELVSG